jgi:hypothetical protein
MFGGEGDRIRDHDIGGCQISLIAVEALRKELWSVPATYAGARSQPGDDEGHTLVRGHM